MNRSHRISLVFVLAVLPVPLLAWFFGADDTRTRIRSEFIVESFAEGIPLFSNRDYFADPAPAELEQATVVRIPRHFRRRIELQIDAAPVTVFRFVCELNDNHEIEGWQTLESPAKAVGGSCTHTRVVRRTFEDGRISLLPGGPVASNPILVGARPDAVDAWYQIELYRRFLPSGLSPRSKRVWLCALLLVAYYAGVGRLSVHRD